MRLPRGGVAPGRPGRKHSPGEAGLGTPGAPFFVVATLGAAWFALWRAVGADGPVADETADDERRRHLADGGYDGSSVAGGSYVALPDGASPKAAAAHAGAGARARAARGAFGAAAARRPSRRGPLPAALCQPLVQLNAHDGRHYFATRGDVRSSTGWLFCIDDAKFLGTRCGGAAADALVTRARWPPRRVRLCAQWVGFCGAGAALVSAGCFATSVGAAVAGFCAATFCLGASPRRGRRPASMERAVVAALGLAVSGG
ncbi:hypothetical protein M885DRAFT_285012 [Pelagophyceae sp. CCMP2097]|nr:hypothetical protein M885DRAFT_285012 [Pelagophyceae sp. CCMP2097]